MSDYDSDILTWSVRQGELLRRHVAGDLANDTELDWPNIAEQIEALGQIQVDQIELWLFQMAVHLLKAEAWARSLAVPHWQGEARGFRAQSRRKDRASMAQKIDLPGIYAAVLQAMPDTIDGTPPLPVPDLCPRTLADLLAD